MTIDLDIDIKSAAKDIEESFHAMGDALEGFTCKPAFREYGTVQSISETIAVVSGLPKVGYQELVHFASGANGQVLSLEEDEVMIACLDKSDKITVGEQVYRSKRPLSIGVGEDLLGTTINPLGEPMSSEKKIRPDQFRPVESEAPPIMHRSPVTVPVQTGLTAVDALVPIGRGQRELILGDRQTGKTAIAFDTIINQKDKNMFCIYCAIGQRMSAVARLIQNLKQYNADSYSTVIVATEEDTPGMRFIAPYAAMALGEYFMEKGKDVLLVMDDLTKHARAYRELSLLLRRPPAREAYPGDIFYIHSRLLERATHVTQKYGGGSITALPIVETQAQNVSAYIPTNLISITDGQIFTDPTLFRQGVLPPIDVSKSVSRVGGKTQRTAYRKVASDLRLSYSQFGELEAFSRFGTQLDENTRKALTRGRRVREVLKQKQFAPLPVEVQVALLLTTAEGGFDLVPIKKMREAKEYVTELTHRSFSQWHEKIINDEKLSDEDKKSFLAAVTEKLMPITEDDTEKQKSEEQNGSTTEARTDESSDSDADSESTKHTVKGKENERKNASEPEEDQE